MSIFTITGNLATAPETRDAGGRPVVKLRIIENTGYFNATHEWVADEPTTHYVDAWGTLGEHASASLATGAPVIAVVHSKTEAWEEGGETRRLVLTAETIGPDLRYVTAQVTKASRD